MEEYTLKEYIDDQVIRLEQRDDFEDKVNDLRLSEIKAVVEKAVTDMKKETDIINVRIDAINTRIDAVNTRIDDLKDAQNQGLTRFGVIVALGVGLIQVITAFVLQFWK